mgnify:CR=1 FL=1
MSIKECFVGLALLAAGIGIGTVMNQQSTYSQLDEPHRTHSRPHAQATPKHQYLKQIPHVQASIKSETQNQDVKSESEYDSTGAIGSIYQKWKTATNNVIYGREKPKVKPSSYQYKRMSAEYEAIPLLDGFSEDLWRYKTKKGDGQAVYEGLRRIVKRTSRQYNGDENMTLSANHLHGICDGIDSMDKKIDETISLECVERAYQYVNRYILNDSRGTRDELRELIQGLSSQ